MKITVFNLGFRIFFLMAGCFAVASVLVWMALYFGALHLPNTQMSSSLWHGHEMIYGYSLAVIAGFLLTSVKNWTGIQTLNQAPLLGLCCLWLAARILLVFGAIYAACILDTLFLLMLNVAVALPIIRAKQWRQVAILAKLALLLAFNLLFYLGVLGYIENGVYWGLYGGLYLIVGLLLMMGRRLMPFFVTRAAKGSLELTHSAFIDNASLGVFVVFFVADLSQSAPYIAAYSALLLFVLHAIRLSRWHVNIIWQSPLLWVLYVALWFICVGFLMVFLSAFLPLSKFAAIHAMSYGGIGLMTLGMMARVTLGHTGRDLYKPPAAIGIAFGLLVVGTVVRIGLTSVAPSYYIQWIGLSQLLWISAFTLFLVLYARMLVKPRIDGKLG